MADIQKSTIWKIPFLVGILLTVAVGFTYRLLNPPIEARTLRVAKVLKVDPRTMQKVEQLRKDTQKIANTKTELPERQWRELVEIFNNPNEDLRLQAISVMTPLGNTSKRNNILGMVRPMLNASPMTQVSTLILLQRFNDPSWRSEAQKRVNSTDKYLSQMASAMLEENVPKQ